MLQHRRHHFVEPAVHKLVSEPGDGDQTASPQATLKRFGPAER